MSIEDKINKIEQRYLFWDSVLQDKRQELRICTNDQEKEKLIHEIEKVNYRVTELQEVVKFLSNEPSILYK
jgi:CTP:phosphocholine cytidylyltransferase-like protein